MPDTPLIVAHRGAMDEAPENTRAAFDAAWARGVDGIELDVQMTRDGVLVLYHDSTLKKIIGRGEPLSALAYAELEALHWGAWYDASFRDEPVLTLEAAVERYASRGKVLVEVKSYAGDRNSGRNREITYQTLAVLKDSAAAHSDHIFILSFDPEVLSTVHETDPSWRTVLNTETPAAVDKIAPEMVDRLSGVCGPIAKLDERFVAIAHERQQLAMTWTCNTPAEADKAFRLGVDYVMTNRPRWLVPYARGGGA